MEENQEYLIVKAFNDSLKTELLSTAVNLGEVALDSFLESGIVKDIPILSTVASLYKLGNSLGDAFYIKKLATFINEVNNNIVDEKTLAKHKVLILSNPDKFKKEIEHILILINRHIDYNKSKFLAKLYIAYLNFKINWNEFIKYSQVIDQLFISDLEVLSNKEVLLKKRKTGDDVLRLSALGLLVEVNNMSDIKVENGTLHINNLHEMDEIEYMITDFGATLISIIK